MPVILKWVKTIIVQLVICSILNKHYKLNATDLSKQIELENPDLKQQINFIEKLEDNEATMFFIIEKSEETTLNFSQSSVSII